MSDSDLYLLNAGLASTEALDPVESSKGIVLLSIFPNLILRVCGIPLVDGETGTGLCCASE